MRFTNTKQEFGTMMTIVLECEALGMSYEEYMNSPKWFTELKLGKRIADNQAQEKRLP